MNMDSQHQKQQRKDCMRSIINFTQGIAVTLLLLAVTVAVYVTVLYRARVKPLTNYAIVFDAGSSHTEMFVYYWPADKSDGLGTTSSVNEYFVCPLSSMILSDPLKPQDKIKLKAISDFEQHLDVLEAYFASCLKEAVTKIPQDRHKFSPIFLGATAGMRLAKLRNTTRANQVLERIREIFSHYPFQFVTARQVRILTGMEEAIDGWITTNILQEKFKHRHENKKRNEHSQIAEQLDTDMVGVLDLGGASTQVTFTYVHKLNDEPVPSEYATNISLFDTVYTPYAHSYLCWGKNEAMKRHRARLFNSALNVNKNLPLMSTSIIVRDPCFVRGTNDTTTVAKLFHSPCTANEKQKFNSSINPSSITFVGTGNATKCHQRLLSLFDAKRNDKTVNCSYKQEYCTFDNTFQPKIPDKINFIGLSGYYYVFNNLAHGMSKPPNSTTESYRIKDFSLEELKRRRINVCEVDYKTLYEQESMNAGNEQHKRGLCFDAWFVWLLLTYGIGFQESDLQRISFANTFPTGKVGWTLGYMINQTNYIPAEFREKPMGQTRFISWLSIAIVTVIVSLVFLLLTCHTCLRRGYSMWTLQRPTIHNDGYTEPREQSIA